ncbi:MAG: hypothetical protein DELT_00345 [Desulfovibrio sp.]
MRQAARMYFETQVTTTSPGQVLILLYDGAIKFLNQAKEKMEAKDYAGKGMLISSAIDVINELASSLNAEKGGELAANLSELYFYCNKRLFMANSRMDPGMIDEVIKILSGIRSAYAQIIDTPEAQAAMAGAPVPVGKPVRSPAGTSACPAGAVPVPAAKAHSAYASMGARSAQQPGATPDSTPDSMPNSTPDATETAANAEPELQIPVAEAAAEQPATAPSMPEAPMLDDMPPITAAKKAAASSSYRKFSS